MEQEFQVFVDASKRVLFIQATDEGHGLQLSFDSLEQINQIVLRAQKSLEEDRQDV
ncbi:hypothetical protein vBKpnAMK6_00024 [Klebsiella phage vB_Kpn_AM_K6]|uniref:Uncharacterized protein n=3 Tax=Sugarlandvirus TaxID=2560233 RepID=A0AAE8YDA1_9CAUD|nr:hypothetical protein [Klebsiella phage vB_KpnS-VAC35]WJE88385.1 hypothetical protein [Klebsiella phage Kpn02]BEH89467.1 hypothetical protein [Klebsiella phage phiKp_27]CAD5239616.1 hypothetical protein IBKLEAMG_00045 [Klebsiella phage vB_KppS-Storm]CAK6598090.1 unknown function [Klebsiella phage vB_Kpn_K30lambda2.2]